MGDEHSEFKFELCDVVGCDKVGQQIDSYYVQGVVLCHECRHACMEAYHVGREQRRELALPIEGVAQSN